MGLRSSSLVARLLLMGGLTVALKKPSAKCDVAIIGGGIGGLSAAAILSARYGKIVQVHESHYRPGGCAHSFPIKSKQGTTYQFDAGPTILLGCSAPPYNPLQQVLNRLGASDKIDWVTYHSWGMVDETGEWSFDLGANVFENTALRKFGGPKAAEEFKALRKACEPLCAGAASIPTMALRADSFKLLPLLGYLDALQKVIPYSDVLDGSFKDLMNEHVTDSWLRDWLDALAFSLSGLPASETGAAALAYTIFDLHREGAALDYPKGGMGVIADVLVNIIESNGGEVYLSSPVESIGLENGRVAGLELKSGQKIRAKQVIANNNIWSLGSFFDLNDNQLSKEAVEFIARGKTRAVTKSFLHLHLGMNSEGMDLSNKQPHYTVMAKGLSSGHDPCGDRNMVAVSNPGVLDSSLTDKDNRIIVHAYGAGNEPFDDEWKKFGIFGDTYSKSNEYKDAKVEAADYLYESVSRALGISIEEVKERSEVEMIGTPLTHQRYLMRHKGTYGPTFSNTLSGPMTPIKGLYLAGDSVFPGIGVPAVAVSGANCANSMVNVIKHIMDMNKVD